MLDKYLLPAASPSRLLKYRMEKSSFGFVYKTSSFIGPFIYALTVSLSDTRVGIFSILIFVAIGTVILGKVDVAAGRLFAERENS